MNLSDMRTRVRRDLHDEDSASYRWIDAELDRHIGRALRELGQAIPRERQSTLATVAGSREIGISSLSDRIGVTAVEWPTGKYPPVYVRFSVWVDTLTMLVDSPSAAVENVNLYWLSLHTLDATTSTLPAWAEDILAGGAAGYAALEWASFAANRLNIGGDEAERDYSRFGQERLRAFQADLRRLGRRASLRTSGLYVPAQPKASQTTDPGP